VSAVELFVDRTGWEPGEWDNELDRYEWTTEAGLPGLIVRNSFGALCGYVAVPAGHAQHGRKYQDIPDVDVHGGLTYSGSAGEPDNVWWFGFDCAHSGDLAPGLVAMRKKYGFDSASGGFHDSYETVRSVRYYVESLARQLSTPALSDPMFDGHDEHLCDDEPCRGCVEHRAGQGPER